MSVSDKSSLEIGLISHLYKRSRTKFWQFHLAVAQIKLEWLIYPIMVFFILIASVIYLWPSAIEFPMDDTYIHFVYAQNLSEKGSLFFNYPGEKGVGDSSLLWVIILAGGNSLGVSLPWLTKALGLACLAAVGIGIYHLLRPLVPLGTALGLSLLVILSGHMLWFALSGMETMLFLAMGILALLCYREQHWIWLGVVTGLLVITRLEGLALVLVLTGIDIWRYRSIRSGLLVAGVICGVICSPWIIYLWMRTGHFIPTSGIGKHFSHSIGTQLVTSRIGALAWIVHLPALVYPVMWLGYALAFILGGLALPAPYININFGAGPLSVNFSTWTILGLAGVVFPLFWISLRRLGSYLRSSDWLKDEARLPLVIFFLWLILHNLCYMVYLPTIGTASRYASLNHIALWLALGLGIHYVKHPALRIWLAAGVFIIALANTVYWNRVYDANLEHMQNVRIAAANYVSERIPENEVCAAFDVGALRYYIRRPIIDLGGLIDPSLIYWYTSGTLDRYLLEKQVSCLIVPGRVGVTQDGVFDILAASHLADSNLFELVPDQVFQIDRQSWLTGYLPTLNYQATVSIYRLVE